MSNIEGKQHGCRQVEFVYESLCHSIAEKDREESTLSLDIR